MKYVYLLLAVLLPSVCFAGETMNIDRQISSSIDNLATRQGDGWYIIIEEPESKKFIQFTWGESEGFYFDLPSQALTKDELDRAKDVLGKHGIKYGTWAVYDKPNGIVVGEQSGFSRNIGNSASLTKMLASEVLLEVYKINPNARLAFEIDR